MLRVTLCCINWVSCCYIAVGLWAPEDISSVVQLLACTARVGLHEISSYPSLMVKNCLHRPICGYHNGEQEFFQGDHNNERVLDGKNT